MHVNGADMQFVIHKNDEAGNKQMKHVQRPMADQAMISHDAERELQKSRTQTMKSASSNGKTIKEEQESKQPSGRDQKARQHSKRGQSEQEHSSESNMHPYKGKHIDFTL